MEGANPVDTTLSINSHKKRLINDSDIRVKAANKLANDFLSVDEISLESRTYLVKTTLPSVVIALEQLLKEIKSRNIPLTSIKQVLESPDMFQKDKPTTKFDSINWLAQNLLRKNHKESHRNDNPYAARVSEVASALEDRIKEIAADKERKRIAAEIAVMLERERKTKERLLKIANLQAQYSDTLSNIFQLWVKSLWRKDPANIFKFEILSQLQALLDIPDLTSSTELRMKIQNLMKIISTPNSQLPIATDENTIFNVNEPLYSLDCATIIRWDQEFFVKMILRLIIDWTLDDLNSFNRLLSSMLIDKSSRMNEEFMQALFIPNFSNIIAVRDWLQQLSSIVQLMDLHDSPFKDEIKKVFQGFCVGKEDPKFTFVSSVNMPDLLIENENPAIGFAETAYVRFAKCVLGEFGMESFKYAMGHIQRESSNQINLGKVNAVDIELSETSDSREIAEASALKLLTSLLDNHSLDLAGACENSLSILSNFFETVHEKKSIFGRISLKETSILKLIDGKDMIKQDEAIANNVIMDSFLRIIACTPIIAPDLKGKAIIQGNNPDYQLMTKDSSILFENCADNSIISQDIFFTSKLLENEKHVSTYLATSLCTVAKEYIGTIALLFQDHKFVKQDILFLEKAKKVVAAIIEKIVRQEKTIQLVLSAKSFIQSRLGIEIEAYLIESNGVFHMDEVSLALDQPSKTVLVLEKNSQKLEMIQKAIAFSSMQTKSDKTFFKPIFIEDNCVAMLQVTTLDDDQLGDLNRFVSVLTSGLGAILAEPYGSKNQNYILDAENEDLNSRTRILFGKLLLMNAREGLAKLDSRALAELKSYRNPPKSIHLIVKGSLYLFGQNPIEIKTWNDTMKLINDDYLKNIASFDPTLPMKIAWYKRAKKVAHILSWRDTNEKSSAAAQLIYDWLFVALLLRDIAIMNRKAKPDIFERISTADSAIEDLDEVFLDSDLTEDFTEDGSKEEGEKDIPSQSVISTLEFEANHYINSHTLIRRQNQIVIQSQLKPIFASQNIDIARVENYLIQRIVCEETSLHLAISILLVSASKQDWPNLIQILSLFFDKTTSSDISLPILLVIIEETLSLQARFRESWISSIHGGMKKTFNENNKIWASKLVHSLEKITANMSLSELDSSLSICNIIGYIISEHGVDQFQNELLEIVKDLKQQNFSLCFLRHHLFCQLKSFQADLFLILLDLASSQEKIEIDLSSLSILLDPIQFSFAGSNYIEKSPLMLLLINYHRFDTQLIEQVLELCIPNPSFVLPLLAMEKLTLNSEQISKLTDWIIPADLDNVAKYYSLARLFNRDSTLVGQKIINRMKLIESHGFCDGYSLLSLATSNEYLIQGLLVIQQKPSFMENLVFFLKFSQPNSIICDAIISSRIIIFILESLCNINSTLSEKDTEDVIVLLLQYSTALSDYFSLTLQGFRKIISHQKFNSFLNISFANDEIIHYEVIKSIFESQKTSFRFLVVEKIIQITSFSSFWNLNMCKKGCLSQFILCDEEMLARVPDSFLSILFRFNCNFEESKLLITKFLKKNGDQIPTLHDKILKCITNAVKDDWPEGYFIFRKHMPPFCFEQFSKLSKEFTFYTYIYLQDSIYDRILFELKFGESKENEFFRLKIIEGFFYIETRHALVLLTKQKIRYNAWLSIFLLNSASMFSGNVYTLYCDGEILFNGSIDLNFSGSMNLQAFASSPQKHSFEGMIEALGFFPNALSTDIMNTLLKTKCSIERIKIIQMLPQLQQPIVYVCHKLKSNISSAKNSPALIIPNGTALEVVSRIPFKISLQALGGIEIIFPLLTQIEDDPNNAISENRLVLIVSFLSSLLENSGFHLKSFINFKGPRLLSLYLQKSNFISIEIFGAFLKMKSLDSILSNAIDDYIIFEPQIWSRANEKTQGEYFEYVLCTPSLISARDLTYWMDTIELYFNCSECAWSFLEKLIKTIKLKDSRIVESLFCCSDLQYTHMFLQVFLLQVSYAPKLYFQILDLAGSNMIINLLNSEKNTSRLAALNIIQSIEYYSGEDGLGKNAKSIRDIPPSVIGSAIKRKPFTHECYLKLLSLCFLDDFKIDEYHLQLKTYGNFKSIRWLSILLETVFSFEPSLKKIAIADIVSCVVNNVFNSVSVGNCLKVEHLLNEYKRSTDSDYSKRITYLFSCYIFSDSKISPKRFRNVVMELFFFERNSISKCSSLFEIILGRMGSIEKLPVLNILEVVDEIFFYHKDISVALHERFDGLPNLYENLEENCGRRSSNSAVLLYQKCYPFEEFSASLLYANVLQKLLSISSKKVERFGNHYTEKCSILLVRLLVSSLNVFDEKVWRSSLNHINTMFEHQLFQENKSKGLSPKYILGALYEAYNLDQNGRLLILPNILNALEACSKSFIEEKYFSKSVIELACTNFTELSSFLDSNEFKSIFDRILYPITREVENEWIGKASLITKRVLDEAEALRKFRSNLQKEEKQTVSLFYGQLDTSLKFFFDERNKRFSLQRMEYEKEKQEISKLWYLLSQEVSFERRVWTEDVKEDSFYKFFPVETSSRFRIRHLRNPDGERHIEASLKRDKLPSNEIVEAHTSPLSLPDRRRILNKKLQSIQISDTEEAEQPSSIFNYSSQTEICIISIECELVYLMMTVPGKLEVTNRFFRFFPSINNSSNAETPNTISLYDLKMFAEHKRPISSLTKVFLRKYKMRNSALESFFIEGDTFLFNFLGSSREADISRRKILRVLQGLQNLFSMNVTESVFSRTNYTQLWVEERITNFQYLMALNTYSGRTFNDLAQYPIFPLIIIDYESSTLDLEDPKIYRDLSKNVGSLNESRLAGFLERYEALKDDPDQYPFMFGTHYSSASSVLFYLLRVEPFTTLHIQLQNGKFDHADRQFHSFKSFYDSVTSNSGDVKELIPEFFYFPDFLRNSNKFDLGKIQSGEIVDDVILPKWASSPEEFIQIHREALESTYVSKNLHKWIDLIWGYKQKGPESIKSNNVFHYLTYDGAVDLDQIENVSERKAIEDQINYFGLTPAQLFETNHPARNVSRLTPQEPFFILNQIPIDARDNPFLFIAKNNILIITEALRGTIYKCEVFKDTRSSAIPLIVQSHVNIERKDDYPFFSIPVLIGQQGIGIAPNSGTIFVAGQFDDSIHSYEIESEQYLRFSDRIYDHLALATLCVLTKCGNWLVTAGMDHAVRLWALQINGLHTTVLRGPKKTLYGHDGDIIALEVSSDLGIIVSASMDGSIIIHSMYHSLSPISVSLNFNISMISMSHLNGDVFVMGRSNGTIVLKSFNINGRLIDSKNLGNLEIRSMITTLDSKYLVLATGNKLLVLSTRNWIEITSFCFQDESEISRLCEYPSSMTNSYLFIVLTSQKLNILNLRV